MCKPESKYLMAIPTFLLLTVLIAAAAQAQTPAATNDNRSDATRAPAIAPRLKLSLTTAGVRLMPSASASANPGSRPTISLMPMAGGPNLQVLGGGTLGRLPKWTGFTSSNSFIGDSTIFEDKNRLVGIGTDTPTSKLTVAGTIQSLSEGFKFPDGTVQTTAGVAPNDVVRSLNALKGDVQLAAGSNITITPAGNTLTVAAPSVLTAVAHDSTLQGNGASGSPLGVAVPLVLTGAGGSGGSVFRATNTSAGGNGMDAFAGSSGIGVRAEGGDSIALGGGDGVRAEGGNSDSSSGGAGVRAFGGNGGNINSGNGGGGVSALGGIGRGGGHQGGIGIFAQGGPGFDGATDGRAGLFEGDVDINGTLSKAAGSFKIDHPLDPENRYLYHSFVESPDMKNIYDGNITTDENGEASVELPDWFEALNRDFRYQLTAVGTFSQAIVAEKIRDNRFKIRTSAPNVEVSWQVTGIRKDAYAEKHRIPVEEKKSEAERGYYLHPEAFNQPEERSVNWARNPEMMRQMKESRESARQVKAQKEKAEMPDR